MKTSSCKAKGRTFQQFIASKISDAIGIKAGKDELIQSREMGQTGTDVRLIGKAKELFNYEIECKNQEIWNIGKWIEQAKARGDNWLLFVKKNRFKPIVIMDVDEFFNIIEDTLVKNR